MNTRAAALAAVVLLSGCGGAGSVVAPAQPLVAPTAPLPASMGTVMLTLGIPRGASSARRAPRYVSPNSAFLGVTILTVNGVPPTTTQVPAAVNPLNVALSTASGGNCTTAPTGETCTVAIPAPTGQVSYRFDLSDASNNKLSTLTQTFTIAPGVTTNLQATLNGIPASVVIIVPRLNRGTSFSGPITVEAFDASGALIVGSAPYASAFTLTDSDASGHTSLTNNAVTGVTITVTSPNDVVILNYDGQPNASFTIKASGGTLPAGGGGSVTVPAT